MFQTVERKPNLTNRVATQLEDLIMANRLQPGDRLPAVPELAAQCGVSRTVIREAIGALAAKGLLEVRHGSRTVVSHPTATNVAQSLTRYLRAGRPQLDYVKVSQVRRALEIEIVGIAAEHRTPGDLNKLNALLSEMATWLSQEEPGRPDPRLVRNDVDFHTALAAATHNELFTLLLDSIADVMLKVRQLGMEMPGAPAYALAAHRAIFEHVEAGQRDGARQAMAEHLNISEDILRRAIEKQLVGQSHH